MSINRPSESDLHDQGEGPSIAETAPGDVYQVFLLDNHEICSGCFRRHDRQVFAVIPVLYANKSGDWVMTCEPDASDTHVLCVQRVATEAVGTCYPPKVHYPENRVAVPAELKRATPPEQRYCGGCGVIDNHTDRRETQSVSAAEMVNMAERIRQRLTELDIEHADSVLTTATATMKSNGRLTGKDDEILAHAVRMAVEHGRSGEHKVVTVTDEPAIEISDTTATDAETVLLE